MNNESTNTVEVPDWFAAAEPVLGREKLSAVLTHVEAIGAEIRAARATIETRQAELDTVGDRVQEAVRLAVARDAEILRVLGVTPPRTAADTDPAAMEMREMGRRIGEAAANRRDQVVLDVLSRQAAPAEKKPTQTFGLWVSNLRRAAARLKVELPAEIKPETPWKDWHETGAPAAEVLKEWQIYRQFENGPEGDAKQGGEEARPEGVKTGENAADSGGVGGEEETIRGRTIRELPEDLRPLMGDPAVNDHGVYVEAERVPVPLPKGVKAEVELKVAKGADDKWRSCYSVDVRAGNWAGVSGPVSVHDIGHPTRDLALAYAARYVLDWVRRQDHDAARKVAGAVEAYVATLDVTSRGADAAPADAEPPVDAVKVIELRPDVPLDADILYEPFDLGVNAGEIAAAEQTALFVDTGIRGTVLLTGIATIGGDDYVVLAHPTEPRGTFTLRPLRELGAHGTSPAAEDPYQGRRVAVGGAGLVVGGADDEILVKDKGIAKSEATGLPGGILELDALGGVTWEQVTASFAAEKIKRGDPAKVPAPVVVRGKSYSYVGITRRGTGGQEVARLVELLPVVGMPTVRLLELKENPSGMYCGRSVITPDGTACVMAPEAGDLLVRPPAQEAKPVKGRRRAS